MKRLLLRLLLFLAVLEAAGWVLLAHQQFWYGEAERRLSQGQVQVAFIGSSRVADAVVPEQFSRAAGLAESAAVNLGRGYSTLAEHYFGLRRLAGASRQGLRGTVVFLEAAGGMPDFTTTWDEPWLAPEYPDLLARTMALADLPSFVFRSPASLEEKAAVGTEMVSSLAALRGSWLLYAHQLAGAATGARLLSAGGVLTGGEEVRVGRELALGSVQRQLQDQKQVSKQQADLSVLASIAALVKREGGELVLFTMPLSSVQEAPLRTASGRRNCDAAGRLLASWGIPLLRVAFPVTDEDFPDSWHLRRSRAPEFSQALAQSWLRFRAGSDARNGASNPCLAS